MVEAEREREYKICAPEVILLLKYSLKRYILIPD